MDKFTGGFKNMNYMIDYGRAVGALLDGRFVRRMSWEAGKYIKSVKVEKGIKFVIITENTPEDIDNYLELEEYTASAEDSIAKDWMVESPEKYTIAIMNNSFLLRRIPKGHPDLMRLMQDPAVKYLFTGIKYTDVCNALLEILPKDKMIKGNDINESNN